MLRLSATPGFAAGVSMHPSHAFILGLLGEDQEEVLAAAAGAPQLFMPAKEDPEDVKPGGVGERVLKDGLSIVPFPEMNHGWTVRGDIKDQKVLLKSTGVPEPEHHKKDNILQVADEVQRAMAELYNFFQANLK